MPQAEFWIVAGPNGAGKTTVVQLHPIALLLPHVRFLNPDDIALELLTQQGWKRFADAPNSVLQQGVSLNPLREIPGKWKQKLLVCGCMAERKRPKTGATKNKRPRSPVRNFDYPDQTKGSRLAAQLREETNALSEKQRSELFQRGMQIVYGGAATKQKSGPGH